MRYPSYLLDPEHPGSATTCAARKGSVGGARPSLSRAPGKGAVRRDVYRVPGYLASVDRHPDYVGNRVFAFRCVRSHIAGGGGNDIPQQQMLHAKLWL